MEAHIRSMDKLFRNPGRYVIPIYQRPYVWDEEKQWNLLWEDIERTASATLELGAERVRDHFLGAIVLQQIQTPASEIAEHWVIDGQQRLITMQLLLDAAELALSRAVGERSKYVIRLRRLIRNGDEFTDPEQPETRFKVWPTAGDQEAFQYAMTREGVGSDDVASDIQWAHEFFHEQAHEWLHRDEGTTEQRAAALDAALREKVKLVAIDLSHDDDPNVIFEALNARGTPLLAWDLIKNHLLRAETTAGRDSSIVYSDHFEPLETDPWWRIEVRQGRLFVPRFDVFLFYWLRLRTFIDVGADELFTEYRKYAANRDTRAIALDLSMLADTYRIIETKADHSPLGRFLERWRVLQVGVITPHLMWLVANDVSDARLERCLLALESFFVRRMTCRVGAAGLNRALLGLLRALHNDGVSVADETVISFLSTQSSELAVWPDDLTFRDHLESDRLYQQLTKGRSRLILEALEQRMREDAGGTVEDQRVPAGLSIEHVMPQHWSTNYGKPSASDNPNETPQEHRDRLVQTLGNLTLVRSKLNSSMSNAAWAAPSGPAKREALAKHSTLFLNKELLEYAGDAWTDNDIIERGAYLADLAIEIWPSAEQIRERM